MKKLLLILMVTMIGLACSRTTNITAPDHHHPPEHHHPAVDTLMVGDTLHHHHARHGKNSRP